MSVLSISAVISSERSSRYNQGISITDWNGIYISIYTLGPNYAHLQEQIAFENTVWQTV